MWGCSETKQDKAEITVVHYIHKISHCPKIVAKRFDVDVVFSAPRKMSRVCSAVERKAMSCPGSVQPLFYLAHIGMWPAAWRWSTRYRLNANLYIGQTGLCLNICLREHERALNTDKLSHLSAHCLL